MPEQPQAYDNSTARPSGNAIDLMLRIQWLKLGVMAPPEHRLFLSWVRAVHGYPTMLRVKHRYGPLGFDLYGQAYLTYLEDLLRSSDDRQDADLTLLELANRLGQLGPY